MLCKIFTMMQYIQEAVEYTSELCKIYVKIFYDKIKVFYGNHLIVIVIEKILLLS